MENSNQTPQVPEDQIQTPSPVGKSNNTKLLIFVLVCVAIVLAIGAYALGAKQSQPVVQNSVQTTPIPSPTPVDETVYTEATRSANWKTYTDKSGILLFKLPQNYLINPKDSEPITIFNWSQLSFNASNHLGQFWSPECVNGEKYEWYALNCFQFGIYRIKNPPNKTLNEWAHRDFYPSCKDSPQNDVPQCRGKADIDKEITIGGKKAYFLQGSLGPAVGHIEIYIELNSQEFIHIGTSQIYNSRTEIGQEPNLKTTKIEEFDQILSTFRFTTP